MAKLAVRVAPPRKAVCWLRLTRCRYDESLIASTDDSLDSEGVKRHDLLRQGILDYRSTTLETNLATFLLRKLRCN